MRHYHIALLGSAIAISFLCDPAIAHDQIPGTDQKQPIAIVGGLVHLVDRPDLENGTVLFEDGKITAVDKDPQLPPNTKKIDATGMHVYPGLIESMSDIGLREINAVDATVDHTEFGSLNPNAKASVAINPDSELIPVARANGVLVAMTAPRGRWLRGQAAVVQLDGWTVNDMLLNSPSGLYVDWRAFHPRGDDPKERAKKSEEKFKEMDELLEQVRRYKDLLASQPNTPTDVRLESLLPVINKQIPIIAEANDQAVIESAVSYAASQGLSLVIYGGYDAADCAELLKAHDVPIIIDGIYRLPRRRNDPYDAPYTLPERLRRSGVRFAIAGEGAGGPGGAANARNLPFHAGNAVAYGLPASDAIRSLTLSAAEILGVDNRIGSITPGKDATLFVSDGDILETESNVTKAFIQGREVDLGSRHKMLYEKYKRKYSKR